EIRQQDVAVWLGQKRAEGFKPSTVEKMRVTFHRSFELAARWSIPGGQVNPVRGTPRPKFNNGRERYLTAAEAERLHKAVAGSSNPQLKNIVGLLLLRVPGNGSCSMQSGSTSISTASRGTSPTARQ